MNRTIHQKFKKRSVEQRHRQLEQNKERFRNSMPKREPLPHNPSPSASESFQREKKLRKRAQKDLNTVQKGLKQNNQIAKEQKQQILDYRRVIAKLKHERWVLVQSNKQVSDLEQKIKEQESLIQLERAERLKAEEDIRQLKIKQSSGQKDRYKITTHTNRVKQLKQANATLKRQLENYNLLSHQKYGDLEKEVKDLRREVLVHRKREKETFQNPMYLLLYLKQHMTSDYLPDLLEVVEKSIATRNLPYFYRGPHNLFYLLMRRVNLLAYKSHIRSRQYHLQNTHNTNETYRLGYLIYEDESWKFVDITESYRHEVYPVIESSSPNILTVDSPAKAILYQEGVKILQLFSLIPPKKPQSKRKYTGTNEQKKRYNFFGEFIVLVIGSRFMNGYKSRLEKHGCKVELHNPYEEGHELLKGKINRTEIILVCERHIPHRVWDYVDKKQPFVSVLQQDSKDLISTHTYLTLKRCELI